VEKSRKGVEILNKAIGWLQPIRKDIKLSETHLDGIFSYHVDSPSPTKRVILYLHGGAYIKGLKHLSRLYKYFSVELSVACDAEVWVPDYRLAPERPYPAALEDAYAVYQSLLDKGTMPDDLFIMGDSAGGGLTLALLMKLRDEKKPLPRAAVTLSAWTDLALTGESMISRDDLDPMFSCKPLADIPPLIVEKEHEKDPYISPLYGTYEGLPPLMMFVGGHEILYDDTLRVAAKAKKAGVEVTLEMSENMPHVYPVFAGVFQEGKRALDQIAQFVKKNAT
jgi:acetyl esterase/lipase